MLNRAHILKETGVSGIWKIPDDLDRSIPWPIHSVSYVPHNITAKVGNHTGQWCKQREVVVQAAGHIDQTADEPGVFYQTE